MTQALIISDMLNDFVKPGGPLYTPGAEELIPAIQREMDAVRREGGVVIYACDAHDTDDGEFDFFPPHAIAGTPGAAIVDELQPQTGDVIIPKKTFDMFHRTEAGKILRERKIKSATVVGVCTHICVMEAVGGLFYRGIKVRVPLDAVADFDDEAAQAAVKRMKSVFGADIE